MSKVIVINGTGGVGKSSFVSLCHEIDPQVIETSTVDFVKEIALKAGWNGIKDTEGRRLLSDLKDALEKYHDIPNQKVDEFIQSHPNNIIFVNVREPHNIAHYKREYNAVTLLVTNRNVKYIDTNKADANVYNWDYDEIISNNGDLNELKEMANWFLTNWV